VSVLVGCAQSIYNTRRPGDINRPPSTLFTTRWAEHSHFKTPPVFKPVSHRRNFTMAFTGASLSDNERTWRSV